MQDTIAKHGKPAEVLGYRLGGAKAISIGERYSVPTTTFNPLLGKTFSAGDRPQTPGGYSVKRSKRRVNTDSPGRV